MEKIKSTLLFLLALLLCLAHTYAFAHDFEVDGIYYNYLYNEDKTVAVTFQGDNYDSYSDEYSGNVVIPASVTYNGTTYSVTSIGKDAFHECGTLMRIEFPSSITSIGSCAFRYCDLLESIVIPNSVTSIGGYAFGNCTDLTSIEIPNSVTSIGSGAFQKCEK